MIVRHAPKGTKKAGVCNGCKYAFKKPGIELCYYMEMEGRSRLKVEYENGGYKEDSCVCYTKKKEKQV